MNNKEYILLAGYRRFNAVKKLGWNKIFATVYNEDKIIEIAIKDIDLGDNSRKDESSTEMVELMNSIKQNGLIQPIVVARAADLTEEDFVALNLTENIQRKDLSPFEISMKIETLKKLGLNTGEIAVRLGIQPSRVQKLVVISKSFKKEHLKNVSFFDHGGKGSTTGKVPYTLARNIAEARISTIQKRILLKKAEREEITPSTSDVAIRLINAGMNINTAVRKSKSFKKVSLGIVVNKKSLEGLKTKYGLTGAAIFLGMLKGKIPIQPKIIYYERDIKSLSEDDE